MLARWGRFVFRFPVRTAVAASLLLVLAIVAGSLSSGDLKSSGFIDESSESAGVADRLATDFGYGRERLVVLLDAPQEIDAATDQVVVQGIVAPLTAQPDVVAMVDWWSTGDPGLLSADGRSTVVVVFLEEGDERAQAVFDEATPLVEEQAQAIGWRASFTAGPAVATDLTHEIEEGLRRAEIVSIPATALVLFLVFGSLVAVGLPVLIGGMAITAAVFTVLALADVTFQSIFALNVISLLGLALGVDYALFMVARYREERINGSHEDALIRMMSTTGRAIFLSGFTVVFGLAATLFFPLPALRSMGLGGMIVVTVALIFAMTLLPALLVLLGPKLERGRIGRRRPATASDPDRERFWARWAGFVMARPVLILVITSALMLALGSPIGRLAMTPGSAEILPADTPSRIVAERLATGFPAGEATSMPVIVVIPDLLTATGLDTLARATEAIGTVPGVERVDSLLSNPAGAGIDWTTDPAALPVDAQAILARSVNGDQALLEVIATSSATENERIVRDIREIDVAGASLAVGGEAALSVDTIAAIRASLPAALVFVIVGSYLILLVTFGSVFLPIKAMAMTLLSIVASLGALVLVFQDGRLSGLLNFEATGQIVYTTPLLLFCIVYGLSMDYGVLLLSRIQESYRTTGDTTTSVADGLAKTARTITSASVIMAIAFGAFMLADVVVIKSLGFVLALAVLIDATIVRALLVPSTMRLLGRWNWWAPAGLTRLVDRLGLTHH